jgi:hypothetical protein
MLGCLKVGKRTPLEEFKVLEPGFSYPILKLISEDEKKHYRLILDFNGQRLEGWVYINDATINLNGSNGEGDIAYERQAQTMEARSPRVLIPSDKKGIQAEMIRIGMLDGVADGKWGPITASAFRAAKRSLTGSESEDIDSDFLAKLTAYRSATELDFKPKDSSDPENLLAVKLVRRMAKLGMQLNVSMGSGSPTYNIVYVSGTNPDGTRNQDSIDNWNDLRFLIQIGQDGTVSVPLCKLATVDAGRYWRENPMNEEGCAQIDKDMQFLSAWCVGRHGSRQYPALVQCGEISITRDRNRKGLRDAADKRFTGSYYGINQHHGYNGSTVGQMSAGCLVAQSIAGHELFMSLLYKDRRYQCSNGYAWSTAILDGLNL